jgi:hypothetical protein
MTGEAQGVSTPQLTITFGHMATMLVKRTRASHATPPNPVTNRRPLEQRTWEEFKPTENDVPGRKL